MRSPSRRSHAVLVMGMMAVFVSPHSRDADAALICQHPRKPRAFVRIESCKKKETPVFDTDAESARLDALEALAGGTAQVAGVGCPEDPGRRLLTVDRDVSGLMSIGYLGGPLCRTLDEDLAGCARGYEIGIYGATACVAMRGKCLPCYQPLEVLGLCRNTCQRPLACTADPERTVGLTACEQAATAEVCDQAWSTTTDYATPTDVIRTTSCFWDGSALPPGCRECTPDQTSLGRCANSCVPAAELPHCRLGGRAYGQCGALDADPVACGLTYETSPLFGTQTCWYDAGAGACRGCDPLDEQEGRCTNGC